MNGDKRDQWKADFLSQASDGAGLAQDVAVERDSGGKVTDLLRGRNLKMTASQVSGLGNWIG